jgi:hypothetical protein
MPVDGDAWDKFMLKVAGDLDNPVEADIVTNSRDVENYWPVLEHGSRKGQRPWPSAKKKTAVSGGKVFSKQAVGGFIEKNAKNIIGYLAEAYTRRVRQLQRPLTRTEITDAANEAGAKALTLLKAAIPVDTGKAKNSLSLRKAR